MGNAVDKKARTVSRRTKAGIAVIVACLAAGGIWYHMAGRLGHWPETVLDLGNNVKMRLVLIPAGKFMMGSPATEGGRNSEEGPQHEVTISKSFYMGVFEVTQEQYEQVMGDNPSYFKGSGNPVENIASWDDAVAFCKKLSTKTGKKVTLPTEAQWEYACRAGTTTAFHTGDALKPGQANANIQQTSNPGVWDAIMALVGRSSAQKTSLRTTPAGSFPPNGFGLYNMHGNVSEWCSDWYSMKYYAHSPKTDPQGPDSKFDRVVRGGNWGASPQFCRSAFRDHYSPTSRGNDIGFRVVLESQ